MSNRRKVLFTDGMSKDFLLIITDATKEDIENYCRWHNKMMEDGGHYEVFEPLKAEYYVKELLDSEIDEKEDLEIIGYDEEYYFSQYTKIEGYRTIKITAGMTTEFELIRTNAPDHVIKAQLMYISACEEEGRDVPENSYAMIEDFGYDVTVIGGHSGSLTEENMNYAFIDEEFDFYDF